MRARAPFTIINQTRCAQFAKQPLRLLALYPQLERYLLERRELAIICRCKAPEVNERLEQRWVEALYFGVIDKFAVDTKPAGHGAPPHAGSAAVVVRGRSRAKRLAWLARPTRFELVSWVFRPLLVWIEAVARRKAGLKGLGVASETA
jgi:hypothetical protein